MWWLIIGRLSFSLLRIVLLYMARAQNDISFLPCTQCLISYQFIDSLLPFCKVVRQEIAVVAHALITFHNCPVDFYVRHSPPLFPCTCLCPPPPPRLLFIMRLWAFTLGALCCGHVPPKAVPWPVRNVFAHRCLLTVCGSWERKFCLLAVSTDVGA